MLKREEAGVKLPMGLVVAVCAAIVLAIPSGAWFMGTLSAAVLAQQIQLNDFKADVYKHRDANEIERRAEGSLVGNIDNRLTRIEAQLTYIIAAQTEQKKQ